MAWVRRSERNRENYFRGFQETVKRPAMLDRPVGYYTGRFSKIPEKVRVSFENGTSAVYALQVEQPAPVPVRRRRRSEVVGYQWKGADR